MGDQNGRIQLYVTQDAVGAEALAAFKRWDLGDILGCEGTLFRTKTGELSVRATRVRLLTKSLRPLPDKFHGMTDQEQKYRQRYVDLITDDAARARFVARSKAVSSIRNFMVEHGFLEVETPMLHPIPGRRQRQALRHPPQRAGPADVPAHRARAVPEAPAGRRLRARVRDQPQLPQRRHQRPAQPRIHDDGVLRGLLDAPRPDGLHRTRAAPRRARRRRHGHASLRRQGGRPRPALRAPVGARRAGGARRPERRPRPSTPRCCTPG